MLPLTTSGPSPVLVALAVSALAASAHAAGQADGWMEAHDGQFAVVSNTGQEQVAGLLHEVERVQAMMQLALDGARVGPGRPAVLFALTDERSLREMLPQFWDRRGQRPMAAYWGGPHRHCIVVRVARSEREQYRRVLHEYVHLLAHENIADLPAWLDEGVSEFWGTAVVHDDGLEVGRPAAHHLRVLRARRAWIPFDALLAMERAPDTGNRQQLSLFYAQAWALTHYLLLGRTASGLELAPPKYVAALREYEDPTEAAAAAFGSLAELERAVREYVRAGRFRTVLVRLPPSLHLGFGEARKPDATYVRELSEAQSLALRAGCVVDGERPAAALPLLTRALAADPNEPAVLETFGYFHFQQNNPIEAAAWFDRAIAAGSTSHLAYVYRAILAGPVDAERLLRRAIDLHDGFAPAYARLADIYIQRADSLEEVLPLLRRATELEPENAAYWVELGKLLARMNRPAEAREAAERGLAAVRSGRSRKLLGTFLRDLTC